ncbi:MAG: hypothetical protein IKA31_05290, partial [Clostridia bacterium]|nr:hypothetical protein [Clostridia bacterium]
NINVGSTATVIIKGQGNFSGELRQTFVITSKAITNANIALTQTYEKIFTGEAIKLGQFNIEIDGEETITIDDSIASFNVRYEDNVNRGTATIKFDLNGNYVATDLTVTFKISQRQYDKSIFIIPNIRTQIHTGEDIEPVYEEPYTSGPIIYVNEKGTKVELVKETDYTLEYNNNKNCGLAYITIIFKGNYTGTTTKSFSIEMATPTIEEFEATGYKVVTKDTFETPRFGEVRTLADLIFVDGDNNEITSITWDNPAIEIKNAGTMPAYVKYNPNPASYNTLTVLINVTIGKGVYDMDTIQALLGEYIEAKYYYGLTLSSIELPNYFTWQYQKDVTVNESSSGTYYVINNGEYEPVSLPSQYQAGETYYVADINLSDIIINQALGYNTLTYTARYNENPDCYETLKNISVTVRVVKGDLNPAKFQHKPINVTYNKELTVKAISIGTSGYRWDETQDRYEELLSANYDVDGEVFYMIYDPALDRNFIESVFGSKYNYNTVRVEAKVYVARANFVRNDVLRALGNFSVTPRNYKEGITIEQLNINLPEGFTFANPQTLLSYGTNECAVVYNYESLFNPNYNSYGEGLTEKIYVNIDITSPLLRSSLDTSNENVVTSEINGSAVMGIWNERLDAKGSEVPFILEYYDNIEGVWFAVKGTASWLGGEEIITQVGYITRQVKFVAEDINFTEGQPYGIFDVKVLITGANADTSTLAFVNDQFTYMNKEILKFMTRVTSTNANLQYLDDIRYTYKERHFLPDGTHQDDNVEHEITGDLVLDAGTYVITAYFDSGKCVYYSFPETLKDGWPKLLTIKQADLNPVIEDVTNRTYGDLIMNNDPLLTAKGIEGLNSEDYSLGIYADRDRVYKVDLNYLTDAGEYYIILELDASLRKNYNFGDNVIDVEPDGDGLVIAKYTINKKVIPSYTLNIEGMLRSDGKTRLNDQISITFNPNHFVDGVIPEFDMSFYRENSLVIDVIDSGIYEVRITFIGNNNYLLKENKFFSVAEPHSYNNLILIVAIVSLGVVGIFITIMVVRSNRKKFKNRIQKEQYNRTKADLKEGAMNNAPVNPNGQQPPNMVNNPNMGNGPNPPPMQGIQNPNINGPRPNPNNMPPNPQQPQPPKPNGNGKNMNGQNFGNPNINGQGPNRGQPNNPNKR